MSVRTTAAAAIVFIALVSCRGEAAPTTTRGSYSSLPPGTVTLAIGETWLHDMSVGCGAFVFFNDTWWGPTETMFHHPEYPVDWPVEVLDQGAVDGPDAVIHATLTLVDEDRIDIRLLDGTTVAAYEPTTDVFLCG